MPSIPNTREQRMVLLTTWVDAFLVEAEKAPMATAKHMVDVGTVIALELTGTTLPEEALATHFGYQVAKKRAQYLKLPLTPAACIAIAELLADSPGTIVMYLTVLKHLHVAEVPQPESITARDVFKIFSCHNKRMSNEQLSKLWDMQKVEHANLLDIVNPETDFILEHT